MTEKLYNTDSHMHTFTAQVLSCGMEGEHFGLVLDRTAFFPEGGGQCADTGVLICPDGAQVQVLDVQEKNGQIVHVTDQAVESGTAVQGELDWAQRFSNMQQHTGEHIVSGLVHAAYGYDNVGFHLGREIVTMDFNGTIPAEDVPELERRANGAVFANLPVQVTYPSAEELKMLEYRSKLELEKDVRIVTIPGVDVCACCAPHVNTTGEIGLIKIVDLQKYKGGVRMTIQCGGRALADYQTKQDNIVQISKALSAKQEETAAAVERQKAELAAVKEKYVAVQGELTMLRAETIPATEGSICLVEADMDAKAMRTLVNLLVEKAGRVAAVFAGNDQDGYRYIIGSKQVDLRALSKELNVVLNGRGGGSAAMIQGSAQTDETTIREYINGI